MNKRKIIKLTALIIFSTILFSKPALCENLFDSISHSIHNLGENLNKTITHHLNSTQAQPAYERSIPREIYSEPITDEGHENSKIYNSTTYPEQNSDTPQDEPLSKPIPPVAKKPTIYLIGDYVANDIAEELTQYYKDKNIRIVNLAVMPNHASLSSKDGEDELYAQLKSLDNFASISQNSEDSTDTQPNQSTIVISLGTGDHEQKTDSDFESKLETLANKLNNYHQKVIWIGTPSFSVASKENAYNNYFYLAKDDSILAKHNDIFQSISTKHNFEFIPTWQDFKTAYQNKIPLLAPDTPAFNDEGRKILTQKLKEVINLDLNKGDTNKGDRKVETPQSVSTTDNDAKAQSPTKKIYSAAETLDTSPILLGSENDSRENAMLQNTVDKKWAPHGRADNFSNY